MKKKCLLLLFALLLMAAANLRLSCRVTVSGEPLAGSYAPSEIRLGLSAAAAAAEEILPGEAVLPETRLRYSLSLSPPEGTSPAVSDAALRATEGVTVLNACSVGGLPFGCVADGERLKEALRASLYLAMPDRAVNGRFAEEVVVAPVYAREGAELPFREVARLVAALTPAVYTDKNGYLILA